MKPILASAATVAIALSLLAVPVFAQPGPGRGGPPAAEGPNAGGGPRGQGWGPGMMMGPGMMGSGRGPRGGMAGMCDPRAAGLAEWRADRIERLIKPTDAQRAALNELQKASAKAAETMAQACPQEFPASAGARMDMMEKRMEAMLAAFKTVRPAFDAFYATLTDEQKAKVNSGGPRHWGWRGWNR